MNLKERNDRMIDYKKELLIKLEEHFPFPSVQIIDRFNEEYEFYNSKNIIETLFLLFNIKNSLEEKGFHPIIKGEITYSLLAYLLDMHNLCPLDNDVAKEYGLFGFNVTQYQYPLKERDYPIIFIRFLLNEYDEALEFIPLLLKENLIDNFTVENSKVYSKFIFNKSKELYVGVSTYINFYELDLLFKEYNLKTKIKEIIEEPFSLKQPLKYLVHNDFYRRLINQYNVSTNEMLYKVIALGKSVGVYNKNTNLAEIVVTREEQYKLLCKYFEEDEAWKIAENIRKGRYYENSEIKEYLMSKGLTEGEVSGICCRYLTSLHPAIDSFLFYKALVYIYNHFDKEFYSNFKDLKILSYENNISTIFIVDKMKEIKNKDNDEKLLNELYEDLNKYGYYFFIKREQEAKDKNNFYIYTSLEEINVEDIEHLCSRTYSLDRSIIPNAIANNLKVIINPNSLNFELDISRFENLRIDDIFKIGMNHSEE